MSELKMMTHLGHHENIVNLLGACTLSGNQFLPKPPNAKYCRPKIKKIFILMFILCCKSQCVSPFGVELDTWALRPSDGSM
jgi:hypothetical protein